jgi:hypothetical protein
VGYFYVGKILVLFRFKYFYQNVCILEADLVLHIIMLKINLQGRAEIQNAYEQNAEENNLGLP